MAFNDVKIAFTVIRDQARTLNIETTHVYAINRMIRYSDVWSIKYIREGQWGPKISFRSKMQVHWKYSTHKISPFPAHQTFYLSQWICVVNVSVRNHNWLAQMHLAGKKTKMINGNHFGAICQRHHLHVKSIFTLDTTSLPSHALTCVLVVVIVNDRSLNLFIWQKNHSNIILLDNLEKHY